MQTKSEIAQNLVNESDFSFVKINLLNDSSAYFCQLGNLLNVSCQLPEKGIMDLEQVYRQSNRQQPALQILRTIARNNVFSYGELNTNDAKQHRDDDMPVSTTLIRWMMKNLQSEIKSLIDLAEWCGMRKRGATESHCLVYQDICRLHRLCRSQSVF